MTLLLAIVAFAVAILLSTFVEYWGHRLMHSGRLLKAKHAGHHTRSTGQGWLREFRDYATPSLLVLWVGFLHSNAVGIGFAAGGLLYGAFAAYAHQLQHERPNRVFWLSQPVHAVHHYHQEWHTNFGITVDFWDRIFGTYKAHPPIEAFDALDHDGGPLDIHWTAPSPPLPTRGTS